MTAFNPLNWTAQPFLTLYAMLMLVMVLVLALARLRLHWARRSIDTDGLDVVEMAFLAGGPIRAADTILVAMLAAGAARLGTGRSPIVIEDAATRLTDEFAAFRSVSGATTRSRFRAAIRPQLDAVHQELARRGLAPLPTEVSQYRWSIGGLAAMLVVFGIAKILVGLARGKPVGILVMLVLVVLLLAVLGVILAPYRNWAGVRAVADLRQRNSRAARAPLGPELPLAFALGGAAILAGTPHEAFARQISGSDGSGGGDSSSGCGGGGGGGCGGCGG